MQFNGHATSINFFNSEIHTTGAQEPRSPVVTQATAGEHYFGSPVVTYLPLANMMFASGKLLPLAIVALANRMFASDSIAGGSPVVGFFLLVTSCCARDAWKYNLHCCATQILDCVYDYFI